MKILLYTALFITLISCQNSSEPSVQGNWIKGTEQEKLDLIENQFRGTDKAMVEIGYRYQELYWGGQDENWEYADYQVDKINKALNSALQRRPKRAKSSQHFLTYVLPEMHKSIQSKDTVVFNKGFKMLTANCNNCHAMENLAFFTVKRPLERQSPIR